MNISGVNSPTTTIQSASSNAVEGIRAQEQRFERNVAEVASSENAESRNLGSQDKALVEQHEIVQSVRANVRSLEAAGQRIGTLIDIQV
ncbi:MAG: hypothetical protein GY806_07985 [Gammaproteobacteria bacterium]|nr:hypothetical protein [Gammaproteobacteria bacterium]